MTGNWRSEPRPVGTRWTETEPKGHDPMSPGTCDTCTELVKVTKEVVGYRHDAFGRLVESVIEVKREPIVQPMVTVTSIPSTSTFVDASGTVDFSVSAATGCLYMDLKDERAAQKKQHDTYWAMVNKKRRRLTCR